MGGPPPAPLFQPVTQKYVRAPARKVPMKSAYPLPVAEFSWEYWFNYFWNEIPNRAKQEEYYFKISPAEGRYRGSGEIPDDEKKRLLAEMMPLGFEPFRVGDRLTARAMYESMLENQSPGSQYQGYSLQNSGVRVVFRGDGRKPSQIRIQQGTSPQTRVVSLAASRSFDKSWHPWNDSSLANQVYFRKGPNQDNCLFSAISVSPEFYVATKFPLLNELLSSNRSAVGLATVQALPLTGAAPGSVSAIRQKFEALGKDLELRCSRTNVYVVKVKKGWNTEAKQTDSFPERAFEHLRWIDHFAVLKVIRIHLSEDGNAGHLIVIEDMKILQDQVVLNKYLGPGGAAALKAFLQSETSKGRLRGDGSGGIPYTPPGVQPPLRIERVKRIQWNA